MPHVFDDAVVAAVLRHMNEDHADDNLLIVRAFGAPDDVGGVGDGAPDAVVTGVLGATDDGATDAVVAARMLSFDGDGGDWAAVRADGTEQTVRVPWPGGPIQERAAVRREVVALYDAACARLGLTPRAHA